MVRFAPHVASFFLVREHVCLADQYRVGSEDGPRVAPDHAQRFAPEESSSPFADADALEELEEEITTLAAHIHAATHRLLTLIAEFDRRRGWELGGHRSCAHWLSFRTGIDLGTAREKVRTARALVDLPETSASMARGELSFSQVRALSRVATEANEGELLELARGCTTAQLERMVRGYRRGSEEDEAERERKLFESRCLSVFPDDEGMYVVRGRLPAELGALLMRAVEAASDALYRKNRGAMPVAEKGGSNLMAGNGGSNPIAENGVVAARLRADALGLVAERALAAGFGGGSEDADEDRAPISGTRAERYQVMLHVEPETLTGGEEPSRSEMEDGTRVSAETSRRLSCDTGVVRIRHAADGSILDVGRRTRTIPPAVRRALEARDRGCRFPGCGLRFTEGHHVKHWAQGGETKLENLVLLCRHHHRLVHEEGWKVDWWGAGRAVFFDPRGGMHFDGGWTWPELEDRPVEALVAENERLGVKPDAWTAGARWKREDDIPDEIYFPALEALGEAGR
jgi:hypothetical protein